jgi:flagellar assembly protein FliH
MSSLRKALIRREQVTWTAGDYYTVFPVTAAEDTGPPEPPPPVAPAAPGAFHAFVLGQPLPAVEPAPAPSAPPPPAPEAPAPRPLEPEAAQQAILGAAVAHAQQILQAARQQAADLTQAAGAQVAEAVRQARAEARQEIEAETAHLLLTAQGVLDEVHAWRENYLRQSERPVLDLILRLGQQIFGNGLTLEAPLLHAAFERALAEAKPLGNLRIHVHPEDAALLDPHWPEQQATRLNQRLELIADASLRRGGCLVEGDYGSVDARVETQLRLAQEALEAVGPDAEASA